MLTTSRILRRTIPCLRAGLSTSAARPNSSNAAAGSEARREGVAFDEIDVLLRQVGRSQTSPDARSGMAMLGSAPWTGISHDDSSFSFSWNEDSASAPAPPLSASPQSKSPTDTRSDAPGPPKRQHESYVEINLPLLSDPALLAQFVSTSGGLRIGKIMERVDSLAGAIGYKHALPSSSPTQTEGAAAAELYLATAGADRLDLFRPLHVQDLRLSGQVAYVGSSSMEVFLRMEGLRDEGKTETLLLGRFTMVARDSITHKARKVSPLLITSEPEQRLFDLGEAHKLRKSARIKKSLSRVPPTATESSALHAFLLSRRQGAFGATLGQVEQVNMADTKSSSEVLVHPQSRNLHGFAFGGYLMRLAYELSYSNAAVFARGPLRFLSLDEIAFQLPVPIGSILRLSATVVHTSTSLGQIHSNVVAEVIDVSSGQSRQTNTLAFTWAVGGGKALAREVVPVTYEEAMHWLEGKRRLDVGARVRDRHPREH